MAAMMFPHGPAHRERVGRAPADPQDVDRLAREAAMLAARGDLPGAMRVYQHALLIDGSRADLWLNYGISQERAGQLHDAFESYEIALREEPAMHTARYRMGRVLYMLDQPLQALAQFREVTRQRPAYLPAWRYVVQITWALGKLEEASELAHEALRHAPDAEVRTMLGHIQQERGGH